MEHIHKLLIEIYSKKYKKYGVNGDGISSHYDLIRYHDHGRVPHYLFTAVIAALALDINIKLKWILIFLHFSNFVNVITKHPLSSNLQSLEKRPTSNTSSELVQDSQEDMGCGQSKEPLTNQKPASELLTNHIAMEAVALKMVESVNKIERVEEEEDGNGEKDDIEKIEEDVSNTLKQDPVVTVEAAQDIKEADEVIKEAEMMDSMKESTNEGKVSDILTNQKPGEAFDDEESTDDPPPPYQTSEGEKNKPYDEVMGAAQLIKCAKSCKTM